MSQKRKVLTLEEHVAVIIKLDSGKSCHSVAEEIGVGRFTVSSKIKKLF